MVPGSKLRVRERPAAHYSRDEALAGFGYVKPGTVRQGVAFIKEMEADLFFVTLNKTVRHYSPTTRYNDYVNHAKQGTTPHLFIRENKLVDGQLGAPPYLYAGPLEYLSHESERPIKVTWRLQSPLPAEIFLAAKVAAG